MAMTSLRLLICYIHTLCFGLWLWYHDLLSTMVCICDVIMLQENRVQLPLDLPCGSNYFELRASFSILISYWSEISYNALWDVSICREPCRAESEDHYTTVRVNSVHYLVCHVWASCVKVFLRLCVPVWPMQ